MTLDTHNRLGADVDRFTRQAVSNGNAHKRRGWKSLGFKPPRAVIDWVIFIVELKRNSHGGHLKNRYEGIGVSYALPLDAGAGGAAKRFRFHLQHPANFGVIDALLSDLDEVYGLVSPAELEAMEVSIDFYHESANVSALRAMTERLMHSVTPPVITNPRVYGGCFDLSDGVLPGRGTTLTAEKTLYIGNKGDDLMWRVYWKRTDETYEGEEGKRVPKPLQSTDWRARVEVRLKGKAMDRFNLTYVRDLEGFSYERLHSAGLFKFTKRVSGSGPLFTNPWSQAGAKSLGIDGESPACVFNQFGRRDKRKRQRQVSHHLVTDTELTEASRQALRSLTGRFGRLV